MSKMSRVAHGLARRQEEMGVGCAHGPIYLCQVWPSGRRTSWRFLRQKREFAAARNCRWRFLELIVCAGTLRLSAWRARTFLDDHSKLRCHQKCRQQAHLSPSLRANGSRECAPDDRLGKAIQCGDGKADCFAATLLVMTAKCQGIGAMRLENDRERINVRKVDYCSARNHNANECCHFRGSSLNLGKCAQRGRQQIAGR